MVFKFQTFVRPGRDAERLTTAFYRFLEIQNMLSAESASIQTEIVGEQERRTISLWSEDAIHAFECYLGTFRLEVSEEILL
jgi:hypothetical protein